MDNFTYQNPVRMVFGRGQLNTLAEQIKPYGDRVLLTYGQGHLKRNGVYERVTGLLRKAGIGWEELPGVHSNPRVELVRQGIEICRENRLGFVLGVGGGSTSDTAKAIAAGCLLHGDVWQAYLDFHTRIPVEQKTSVPGEALPVGVVMTKAGTGSDFDLTSVMSNWETHEKLMIIYPCLFPKFAICDPELHVSLSADQTAYGTADMMTHIFEQYFSHTPHSPAQDWIKEGILRTMIEAGPRALADPEDVDTRADLLYCASWACSQLVQQGVVNDWGSHLIEHELSAITDVNHGLGMAVVYPGWMRYVVSEGPGKFAQYAERVWGITREGRDDTEVALEGIDRTQEFWKSLGIPTTLREAGVDPQVIPQAAKQAVRFGPISAYRPLHESDVRTILESVA